MFSLLAKRKISRPYYWALFITLELLSWLVIYFSAAMAAVTVARFRDMGKPTVIPVAFFFGKLVLNLSALALYKTPMTMLMVLGFVKIVDLAFKVTIGFYPSASEVDTNSSHDSLDYGLSTAIARPTAAIAARPARVLADPFMTSGSTAAAARVANDPRAPQVDNGRAMPIPASQPLPGGGGHPMRASFGRKPVG